MEVETALVDTDVFSVIYFARRDLAQNQGHPVDAWTSAPTGARVVISFQTRAEILSGALSRGWGERRLDTVRERLDATPTVDTDEDVVEAFAQLTRDAGAAGHPIHQKILTADHWIAAYAVSKGFPLLSGDGIYRGAPGLRLLEIG